MNEFIYTVGVIAIIFVVIAVLGSWANAVRENTAQIVAEKFKMKVFLAERARREAENEAARKCEEGLTANEIFLMSNNPERFEKIRTAGEIAFSEIMKKNYSLTGEEEKP